MGRGRGRPARARGRGAGRPAAVVAEPSDPNAWMHDVDLQSGGEPISPEHLRRLYRLDRRCVATIGTHKGKLCEDSPDCLVSMYSTPSLEKLVQESIGTKAPPTMLPRGEGNGVGLKNLANTCYLNSVTQMLARCPRLIAAIASQVAKTEDPKGHETLDEYSIPYLFTSMRHSAFSAVDPAPMVEALKLDVKVQQDAQEYLSLFLSLLSDSSANLNDEIVKDFNGHLLYSRKCGACGAVTKKTDRFLFLTAPVVKNGSITDCALESCKVEETSGASCESCNGTNVTIETTVAVKTVPKYLIVHLLRFQYDVTKGERRKVADPVVVQRTFPVSDITGDKSDRRWYRVRAVVDHLGRSPMGGHYIASAVPLAEALVDADGAGAAGPGPDEWEKHDDTVTTRVKPFPASDPMAFTSKDAYMVLYELVDEPDGTTPLKAVQLDAADDVATADARGSVHALEMREDLVARVQATNSEATEALQVFSGLKDAKMKEAKEWESLCDVVFVGSATNATRGKGAPTGITELGALLAYAEEERYFVSEPWLKAFASGAFFDQTDRRVKNQVLVCRHGPYVDPSMPYRIVTRYVWEALRNAIGADVELKTTAMCQQCARQRIEEKQRGDAALDAWRALQSLVRAGPPSTANVTVVHDSDDDEEAQDDDADVDVAPMYIALNVYDNIVSEQSSPPTAEEAALLDLTAPLVCPHGSLDPHATRREISAEAFNKLVATGYKCAVPMNVPPRLSSGDQPGAVCDLCVSDQLAEAKKISNAKSAKFGIARDVTALARHDNNRSIFDRNLVNYAKQHRKQWAKARDQQRQEAEAAAREKAEVEAEARKKEEAAKASQMKITVRAGKKASSAAQAVAAASGHADPAAGVTPPQGTSPTAAEPSPTEQCSADAGEEETCPDRVVEHYVVPMTWVKAMTAWIEDATHLEVDPPPSTVSCSDFVCLHNKSLIGVDDLHPARRRGGPIAVVLKEAEFEALQKYFQVDEPVFKLVEVNESRVTNPPECEVCVAARRAEEHRQASQFKDGTITVNGKFKKTKKHRLIVTLDILDVQHDTTLEAFAAMVSTAVFNSHAVFVPPEHIDFVYNKEALSDRTACFSGLGILDGSTVGIEVGDDVVANAKEEKRREADWEDIPPELLQQAGKPGGGGEVAFGGSALAGRAGNTASSGAGAVKECPACTFHNAPTANVCEICESVLPA